MNNKKIGNVEIVCIPTDYINKLNKFLTANGSETTTAHWNKQIVVNGFQTEFYRPWVCFKYSINNEYCQVFPLSSFKPNKDRIEDIRFYNLMEGTKIKGKVVLTKPILVPTKMISTIDFPKQINIYNGKIAIKDWLVNLNYEKQQLKKEKEIILARYHAIKYSRNIDFMNYSKANKYLINEDKVEKFCKREMKLIEKPN